MAGESLCAPLTGIGQYTRALLSCFADELPHLQVFSGSRLLPSKQALHHLSLKPQGRTALRRWLREIPGLYEVRQRLRDRRFHQLSSNVKLYHETNYILKPFAGACVTTIHDLSHLAHPEFHPAARVRFLERHLPDTVKRASRIITVSHFSRDELIKHFGIASEKIVVTPLAPAQRFRLLDEKCCLPILTRYRLRWKRFILTVATIEPRKNLRRLVQAFLRLPVALRRAFPLVLAGSYGWKSHELVSVFERLASRGEAIKLDYVADDDVPVLMNACRCFAYPSLYEGFGLPVIEAQACGTVVMTGNSSALPEIAAETCLLVEPRDVDALSAALQRAIEDEDLRSMARCVGPKFAASFSWRQTAHLTLSAYRAALELHD